MNVNTLSIEIPRNDLGPFLPSWQATPLRQDLILMQQGALYRFASRLDVVLRAFEGHPGLRGLP
jgi:hypothetical protein